MVTPDPCTLSICDPGSTLAGEPRTRTGAIQYPQGQWREFTLKEKPERPQPEESSTAFDHEVKTVKRAASDPPMTM